MALGGLGAILLSGHPSLSPTHVLSQVDLRSAFLAVVFLIIVLVLAYLTNPSETSFRTYLTELSFKQHLSRLDDGGPEDGVASDDSGVHFTRSRKPGSNFDPNSPFHFVSRASVSLRTPKHVFYSFGILTIAAVYPTGRSNARGNSHTIQSEHLGSLVSDAWYVGAFGRWWRGGIIQSWWHELLANTKDTERCGSGILDVKALDVLEGLDGLPLPTSSRLPQDSSTKLRGPERNTQRSTNNAHRSTTPPPLPKSASLPLHAPRVPATPPKVSGSQSQRHAPPSAQSGAPVTPDPPRPSAPPMLAYSPSAPSLWDSSPIIAEVLRQISQSKQAVHDLRTQLADFRNVSSESHASIQTELEAQRERKREEDVARAELKGRTKTLEDSKRTAESSKRDAEKRLRAAESARDSAAARIERLGEEIGALRSRMQDDEEAIVMFKEEGDAEEKETQETLERKKKEIKVAEEVVAALNVRAKELEERIAQEEERLRRAKEQAEIKKQDRSFYPLTVVPAVEEENISIPLWAPHTNSLPTQEPTQETLTTEAVQRLEPFPQPIQAPKSKGSVSSGSGSSGNRDVSVSPRPARLSLTGISNLREPANRALPDPDPNGQVLLRPRGFPLFGGDLPSTLSTQSTSTRFSPFGDSDDVAETVPTSAAPNSSTNSLNSISPMSSNFIPSSLITSLDGPGSSFENLGVARSFQSDDDTVLSRDWRKNAPFPPPLPVESPGNGTGTGTGAGGMYTTSPSTLTCPGFDGVDKDDPFEVRPPPLRRRLATEFMDLQRAAPPSRTISDPPLPPAGLMEGTQAENDARAKAALAHRRWSSQQDAAAKERKGLNPEAKAFSLTKKPVAVPPSLFSAAAAVPQPQHSPFEFDPRGGSTPSLAGSSSLAPPHSTLSIPSLGEPDGVFSSISMRAFAPSPAEREALQRALGGSTNASLERLPTLSEVSSLPVPAAAGRSIPPSPSHPHAHAAHVVPPGLLGVPGDKDLGANGLPGFGIGGGRTLLGPGLAWLQNLPRVRKPKFSPWEDEEKELEAGGAGAGAGTP
ncbi:hypothetical protein L226DRAFT_532116 [Lentinus tigrinus ALCF2SS1-7]|uniref:Proteophosphoglycan ppg4 n=1 Tax=Lentinus tigrinus ALCF2SS1-6 TaxID=1328759 RepID=A0A5C2S2E8_9APHY|nr:hypothetical protein L227DRAFT_577903 [Lentinus tigrinus ALCF2SS1-6]RPD78811.1 hypothetical protein L226DRAFT_532116 [Lentinus tigrinus ALCF2SS1-7]